MMPFLQHVAHDLLKRTHNDLSHTLVVFPGKRASLFLDEYLTKDNETRWAPQYTTINGLFELFCPLTLADPIDTACRIYRHYAEITRAAHHEPDTLDTFYGWAERLLADFNDVDKALVDAQTLFVNIADLREIEAKDFLTEEQKHVLRQFFKDFDPDHNSYIRRRFLHLWRAMPQIYNALRKELNAEGLAYEGMQQRQAVENLKAERVALPHNVERVAIVGFNVLNAVEQQLFKLLQRETEVLFYWDYDAHLLTIDSPEAQTMRRNLQDFPNALPEECFHNLLQPKTIEYISATTDGAQARYVAPWLKQHLTPDARRTAIVLCDENLLQPVLHALPAEAESINITKGYPLVATQTYATLARHSEQLEKKGATAKEILNELTTLVATTPQEEKEEPTTPPTPSDVLEREARFLAYTILARLGRLVEKGHLTIGALTLQRILKQVMRRESIPLSGEPVEGLQIMGLLETRCLNFDNVLILSADDHHLPRTATSESFIPYFLREAYHLPTHRENDTLYAHYFQRLIARAKHVTLLWSTADTATNIGEMSRYMTALMLEVPSLNVQRITLQAESKPTAHTPLEIPKPDDIAPRLTELSPSALNMYLTCPVKFYFQRLHRLKAFQEPTESIAKNHFGTIFHNAAQLIYSELSQQCTRTIYPATINSFLSKQSDERLNEYLQEAFLKTQEAESNLPGTLNNYPVEREVLKRLLKNLLKTDARLSEINIVALERNIYTTIEVSLPSGIHRVRIGGTIDRLDRVRNAEGQELLRVLDYKTGSPKSREKFKSVPDLFERQKQRPEYIFQTFLYALAVAEETTLPIHLALHYTNEAIKPDYDSFISLGQNSDGNVRPLLPEFQQALHNLVGEILNTEQPFQSTVFCKEHCNYCDFRHICQE